MMLETNHVDAYYGSVQVLQDISVNVDENEIVVLIGPNGHGKSSILRTIAGLIRATKGTITFDGKRIETVPAHKITELGLVLVPEGGQLFPMMTVAENLKLGAYVRRAWKKRQERFHRVCELFPRLQERKNQIVWTLSGGERRMVAIGKGLMSDCRLLLLDEPSMGLAPIVVQELFEKVREISQTGVSILLAEQNVSYTADIADRMYLVEKGAISLEGEKGSVLNNEYVKEAYLGMT